VLTRSLSRSHEFDEILKCSTTLGVQAAISSTHVFVSLPTALIAYEKVVNGTTLRLQEANRLDLEHPLTALRCDMNLFVGSDGSQTYSLVAPFIELLPVPDINQNLPVRVQYPQVRGRESSAAASAPMLRLPGFVHKIIYVNTAGSLVMYNPITLAQKHTHIENIISLGDSHVATRPPWGSRDPMMAYSFAGDPVVSLRSSWNASVRDRLNSTVD